MKKLSDKFLLNFNENVDIRQFYWMKFWIGLLFLWKLLSRDFGNITYWPESVLSGYPIDIYRSGYILITGVPILFDIATLHFIHWFSFYPDPFSVQIIAMILSVLFILAPVNKTRIVAIFLYASLIYLWGFVFRLGQDIDAVFLLLGSLFIFCLIKPEKNRVYYQELRMGILCIFVIYYFFSGFNKIVDLDYTQWIEFDLVTLNAEYARMFQKEQAYWWPLFPEVIQEISFFLSVFGALLTYIIHITAPLLLFSNSTSKMVIYIAFYLLFHFLTIYVGIFFHMNFFAWLILIPLYKIGYGTEGKIR